MSPMIVTILNALDLVERTVGTDLLVSLAALAIIVLFLYVEGGTHSRPSH